MRVKKWRGSVLTAFVIGGLSAATLCSITKASTLTESEIFNLKSPDRQAILEEGARKEGELVFYSSLGLKTGLEPLTAAFMKKYPFIKVSFWKGNSLTVPQKILTEMRAGVLGCDVIGGAGVATTLIDAEAVQPFWSPSLEVYPEAYLPESRLYAPTRLTPLALAYNTNLVHESDAPQSYDDLLKPHWKDKMVWAVGSRASGAILFISNLLATWGGEKTEEYLAELAKQNIRGMPGGIAASVQNQVIRGEYELGLMIPTYYPVDAAETGAPIAAKLLSPTPTISGTVLLPKGSKRPYSAMLFVDFFLGTEGQAIIRDNNRIPASPEVPPRGRLMEVIPEASGVEENFLTDAQVVEYGAEAGTLFERYFRH